eukprot:1161932-Pelagomonas_calceolata.AAC.6
MRLHLSLSLPHQTWVQPMVCAAVAISRKSYASNSHLKRCIKEGPTPTATKAKTRDPTPPVTSWRSQSMCHIITRRSPHGDLKASDAF